MTGRKSCGIVAPLYRGVSCRSPYAGVAQSVEQLIRNQQVRCSSHPTSSKARRNFKIPAGFCFVMRTGSPDFTGAIYTEKGEDVPARR